MCGLIATSELQHEPTLALASRGPDSNDQTLITWGSGKLLFRHFRLAINGVEHAGSQPLQSKNGRFVMLFNGEIFNFRELNKNEKFFEVGAEFSDSDVLIELISTKGIERALSLVDGMYAVVIYDAKKSRFILLETPRARSLYISPLTDVGSEFVQL